MFLRIRKLGRVDRCLFRDLGMGRVLNHRKSTLSSLHTQPVSLDAVVSVDVDE